MDLIVLWVALGVLAVATVDALVRALSLRARALAASQEAAARAEQNAALVREYGPLMTDMARLQWLRGGATARGRGYDRSGERLTDRADNC